MFSLSVPIELNEPLSVLQTHAQTFEYSYLLDIAVTQNDQNLRIAYIGAYVMTCLTSACAEGFSKPFNALLGETFEFQTNNFQIIFE